MIKDTNTVLIDSSNFMDFRSLSLVKELGVLVEASDGNYCRFESIF